MATASFSLYCEPCQKKPKFVEANGFCFKCHEFYCEPCTVRHQKLKITRDHCLAPLETIIDSVEFRSSKCEGCDEDHTATNVCAECKEAYCTECSDYHINLEVSKTHHLVVILKTQNNQTSKNSNDSIPSKNVPQSNEISSAAQPITQCADEKLSNKMAQMTTSSRPAGHETSGCEQESATPSVTKVKETSGRTKPLSAKCIGKFKVRLPHDESVSYINRMMSLPDGRIIFVDSKNKKLKLFSETYHFVSAAGIPGLSRAVCIWDNNTVALAAENKIMFYRFHSRCQIEKMPHEITTDGDIYDIAYYRGAFICLCKKDKAGHLIMVHSDGRTDVMKRNILDGIDSPNFLEVYEPAGILIGYYQPRNHQLQCFSFDGTMLWSVPIAKCPKGIAACNGSILIAEFGTNSIHQVSCDGYLNPTPLITITNNKSKPHAITIQNKRNRLLVSNKWFDSDNILVYQLSEK